MLSPFRRVEPDSSLQPLHQDMATPIHPHRPPYYHGTEQCTVGHYAWQPWQDTRMQAMVFSAHANGTLNADTVSPSSASSLETQNNLSTPETAFDNGFAGPLSSIDGYLDFLGNSESMLPQTGPFVPPDNQFGEWNNLFPSMSFPDTLRNFPSTVDTCSRSSLNQIAMSEDPGFGVLDNNSVWSIGPSVPTNDHFLLTYAGCFPFPFHIPEAAKI
jgi:hypothetical protein